MKYFCGACVGCEHIGGMKFLDAQMEEGKKLDKERAARLDNGETFEAIAIDFENRRLALREKEEFMKDPAFVALNEEVEAMRAVLAASWLEEHGWHRKFSGEWVKKEV